MGIFPFVCKRRMGGWFVRWWRGAERGEEAGVDETEGITGMAFGGRSVAVGDPLESAGAVDGALLDGFD